MIEFTCDYCGKVAYMYPYQYKRSKNHFCSSLCSNQFHNPEKNKTLMTPEVRKKLRESRLNKGEQKTYTKLYGRHLHRIVAEEILGRPLRDGEVVHHIDGDKRNNSRENIMIFDSQAEHARWHKLKEYGGDANAVHT